MRVITFNQWRNKSTCRRCLLTVGIGRVDLFSFWWYRGGRIGVTLLGFGVGVICEPSRGVDITPEQGEP